MTLNYQKIMKRYPKPNGTVGSSIPDYEMFPSLDEKTYLGGHMPLVFQNNIFLLKN
jgi:hypothetical protein